MYLDGDLTGRLPSTFSRPGDVSHSSGIQADKHFDNLHPYMVLKDFKVVLVIEISFHKGQ